MSPCVPIQIAELSLSQASATGGDDRNKGMNATVPLISVPQAEYATMAGPSSMVAKGRGGKVGRIRRYQLRRTETSAADYQLTCRPACRQRCFRCYGRRGTVPSP